LEWKSDNGRNFLAAGGKKGKVKNRVFRPDKKRGKESTSLGVNEKSPSEKAKKRKSVNSHKGRVTSNPERKTDRRTFRK